jgi:acetyl/propionyl-CoA carboxylase alpha subunit
MRRVDRPDQLTSAVEAAGREASKAFGESDVYLEKMFTSARHIEVQIFADAQGNCVHVGDRDCTMQRRHQKVIEEAPAPKLSDEQHAEVRGLAVRAARAANYVNAGTVEFLFDGESFYLLEVNTRIQVEHCVSEAISGIDLVAEQLRVASGEALSFQQEDVELRGVAIEARIYAEDPSKRFFPSPGTITAARFPAGAWVREERAVEAGHSITAFYDGLIAKLVVWGRTREEAIARTSRALAEYHFGGIATNVGFLQWLVATDAFRNVTHDTGFIEREFRPDLLGSTGPSLAPPSVPPPKPSARSAPPRAATTTTSQQVSTYYYRARRPGVNLECLIHVVPHSEGFAAIPVSPQTQHWAPPEQHRTGATAEEALRNLEALLDTAYPDQIFPELATTT